jgi:hypothetical protein
MVSVQWVFNVECWALGVFCGFIYILPRLFMHTADAKEHKFFTAVILVDFVRAAVAKFVSRDGTRFCA